MERFVSRLALICCVALFTVGIAISAPKPRAQSTIAVPKFLNITKDASVEWLSSGFAETLSTKLAGVAGLQLVERARLSDALKELKLQSTALVNPLSAKKLGLFVGAEYVIVGSFQKVGDKIKADVRQIEVETGKVTGAVDVTGPFDSVLELQSELSIKLIGTLGRNASATESEMLAKPETSSIPAYEWNARGGQQTELGQYEDAIVSFTRALQLDGRYAGAYYNRGLAHYGNADLDSAIADYSMAIELDAEYFNAYNNRGVVYNDKGQFQKAVEDFNIALKLKANSPEVLNNRANSYKQIKEYQLALSDYNAAIKLRPKDSLFYYNRGNLYLEMGRCEPADDDYSNAIELNPTYEQAYNNRGSCSSRQGLCLKALGDYKKAIALDPNYATPYFNMALELEGSGRTKEAVEAYRKYVKLAGTEQQDRIQKALKKIQKLTKGK